MIEKSWFLIPLMLWILVKIFRKEERPKPPEVAHSIAQNTPPKPSLCKKIKASEAAETKVDMGLERPDVTPKKKARSRLAKMIIAKEILERRE